MWISKKEYVELLETKNKFEQDRDIWEAKYKAATEDRVTIGNEVVVIPTKILNELAGPFTDMQKELENCRNELDKYRQLYADEVQKRLELIEKIEEVRI